MMSLPAQEFRCRRCHEQVYVEDPAVRCPHCGDKLLIDLVDVAYAPTAPRSGALVGPAVRAAWRQELDALVADDMEVDIDTARRLVDGLQSLWDQLAGLGLVDVFGGSGSRRVVPQVIRFAVAQANLVPIDEKANLTARTTQLHPAAPNRHR